MSGVSKIVAARNQRILLELALKPGNDVCADCKARAPRWASHNLGIFICVNCASIHRKIGTHITKVKSVTLDEWTKEQVEVMKEKGNIRSNALHNPNESRHPPPTNMIDSERDSELEKFIRSKYEFKRFMDRKAAATSQHLGTDPRASSLAPRARSTPLTDSAPSQRRASPGPLPPPKTPQNMPLKPHPSGTIPSASHNEAFPTRSVSQPLPSDKLTSAPPLRQSTDARPSVQKPTGRVWEDLISLQGPSQSSSLPFQYSPAAISSFPSQLQPQALVQPQPTTVSNAPNPFMNLSLGQGNATMPLAASPISAAPQFPFASAPLSSPALHLGATNPFNQTAFATSANPFSSSPMLASMAMSMSTPTTPSMQPVMPLPTGAPPHTPPLPYASQASMSTPFTLGMPPAPVAYAQSPYTPAGQVPLPSGTNPFSAMQMGQGYSGTPQTTFNTPAFVGQQQPLGPTHGFVGWTGQGAQGTF